MAKGTCSIAGCESPARSRGWCKMHYGRWHRHGDPFADWGRLVTGSRAQPRRARDRTWAWTLSGSHGPQSLASAMFNNASVSLIRKQRMASELISATFPASGRLRTI